MQIFYLADKEKICSVCFLNKGDDFDNVIHGIYYSQVDCALSLIKNLYCKNKENKKIYFFPGAFFADFREYFDFQILPGMYAKELNLQGMKLEQIFVRSLQGT